MFFTNSNQTLEDVQFKDEIKATHCKNQGINLVIIDGRKKRDTGKRMLKYLIEILKENNIESRKDINWDEVEKIYINARLI